MIVPDHIFKGYDIRGIYPTDYNEENIVPITRAVYTFLNKGKQGNQPLTLVVGTDMRTSSPSLTQIAINTLVAMGAHVIDIGMVSTPTFYFAVSHYGFEAGIQITASHNPKEWNGMKIVKNSPKGLIKIGKSGGLTIVKEMAMKNEYDPDQPGGKVEQKTGILEEEVENSLRIVGNPEIKKFKIVADPANAMGIQYIGALFEKVPANLVKMNFEYDGTFPAHQPDPLQLDTLVDLQKRVLEEKADLGLAPDGDGDRLFFIDENGQVVPPTIITSIITNDLLKRFPKETVLVDIRYILTPKKIIEENGGKMVITKVGHAYITEGLHDSGGIFAGESSAHYFFRETGNAESQMPVILTVLKTMTAEKKTLSQLVDEYRRSYESGEFNYKVANSKEILEKAKEQYKDGEVETMDGIAVTYPSWRFSLRTSNTEPLLRLNVESDTKEEMETKRSEMQQFIEINSIKE